MVVNKAFKMEMMVVNKAFKMEMILNDDGG